MESENIKTKRVAIEKKLSEANIALSEAQLVVKNVKHDLRLLRKSCPHKHLDTGKAWNEEKTVYTPTSCLDCGKMGV